MLHFVLLPYNKWFKQYSSPFCLFRRPFPAVHLFPVTLQMIDLSDSRTLMLCLLWISMLDYFTKKIEMLSVFVYLGQLMWLRFPKQPLTCPLIVLYLAVWDSTDRMQEQPQNQGWNAEYLFSSPFPLGDPWMWAEARKWGHRHRGTLSRRISSSAVYAC